MSLHNQLIGNAQQLVVTLLTRLLKPAMISALVLLAACGSTPSDVKVVTIPTLPAPILMQGAKEPQGEMPPVITMDAEFTGYLAEACDALKSENSDEKQKYQGVSRGDACDWAIIGFTVQDWLSFKEILTEKEGYVDQLKIEIDFYKRQLQTRYETTKNSQRSIDASTTQKTGNANE